MKTRNFKWPSSRFIPRVQNSSIWILLVPVLVLALLTWRFISFNQAVVISVGFGLIVSFGYLSSMTRLTLALSGSLLVSQIPIRYVSSLDLLAVASAVAVAITLRESTTDRKGALPPNKWRDIFAVSSVLLATLALISSIYFWRDLSFVAWLIFPILAASVVLSLTRSNEINFEKAMLAWLFASSTLLVVDAVGWVLGNFRSTDIFNAGRFFGSLGDYELSAELYGICILVAVYFVIVTKDWKIRALALIEATGFTALLASTQTRSAFLLVLAGAVFLISASGLSRNLARTLSALAVLLVSIPLLTLTQVNFSEIVNRLSVLQVGQELPELLNRGKVWGYFERLPSFQEAFAFGNGFSYPFDTIQTYPHSLYFWIYWSGGIVALVFLCAAILAAFVYSVRRIKLNRINASLALSIVVFLAIDQSKIEVARFSSTTWLFWLMLALTFSRILPNTEIRDRNHGG